MVYLELFISFLKIGLLGFGGGMSIIALIQIEVTNHGWMTETEFLDIVGISQVTPGPIGMNCATYVGYTATGSVWGSLIASIAIVIPSLIIMLTVCSIYMKIRDKWADNKVYQVVMRLIRIAVVCLIAFAAYRLCNKESFIDTISYAICAVVFVCSLLPLLKKPLQIENPNWLKTIDVLSHPILLVVLAGVIGAIVY